MSADGSRNLGQIAETFAHILHLHADPAARANETWKKHFRTEFLEFLEEHTAEIVSPVIQQMRDNADMPPEITRLLDAVAAPQQEVGSFVQQFFVYGLMMQLAQTLLAPLTQEVLNQLWQKFPDVPLSAPDAADMVVRGIKTADEGAHIATMTGVSNDDFAALVEATGDSPPLELLYKMLHLGIIDDARLTKGIRQGKIKDEWIDNVIAAQYDLPSISDLVAAVVQAQLSLDDGRKLATILGLQPPDESKGFGDFFQLLVDTHGRPPGPGQLADMANRGIIPREGTGQHVTSFQQGIAESDVKTKWTDALAKLSEYLPPPREAVTLLKNGALSSDQVHAILKGQGLTDEMATAYVHSAINPSVMQQRHLAATQVVSLYESRVIDRAEALTELAALGYSGTPGDQLLELADSRFALKARNQLASRVHSLYVAHHIDKTTALEALKQVGIPESNIAALITDWEYESAINVKTLTPGEYASALYYKVITSDQALAGIQSLGYSAYDAWVLLSNRMHGPQGAPPPKEPPSFVPPTK